jgi:trimethylamine--corrinoid protein Co-methyltransferase
MALDVIHKVGPRGHYLKERHTRNYFHKLEFSEIVHVYNNAGGYRDPIEVAREKTNWILENHHPEPLSEVQKKELDRVLQAADKELSVT